MRRENHSLLLWSLFVLSVVMNHSVVLADAPNPDAIEHMKAGHTKVEGVISQFKSGLYTVRTSTGATYTLDRSALRSGHDVPSVGDDVILWVNEGNMVMDAHKKGISNKGHHFISGKLVSINYGKSQMTLTTSSGEKGLKLRPESRMFTDIAVGTPVTVEINEGGEVIDLHVENTSDMPHSGLNHPDNGSALKGFRHLGKPE